VVNNVFLAEVVVPSSNRPDLIVEVDGSSNSGAIESGRKAIEKTSELFEHGLKATRVIAGGRAFRVYSPVSGPATNSAGNFRGVVKSAKWKTRFDFVKKVQEGLENEEKEILGLNGLGNVFMLIGIAGNITENSDNFDAIWNSNGVMKD
jgi:hypothetical protein